MPAQKGIVTNSKDDPGLPLRNIQRIKLSPHAYQLLAKGSKLVTLIKAIVKLY
ncbi:MAG: hypothetical protein ABIN94_19640 [Ferruginibacter sp.]